MGDESDHTLHFGYYASPTEGETATLRLKRPAARDELDRASDAATVIRSWLIESPFHRLRLADQALNNLVGRLSKEDAPGDGLSEARQVQSVVSDWLSKFRAFDDQTSHFLSRQYNPDRHPDRPAELAAFKQSLSLEYDLNSAYRFCAKLRNYAQHAGDPLQNIRFSTKEASAGNQVHLSLEFHPAKLLERYDEWGAVVRKELEKAPKAVGARPVLLSAFLSCERAFASLVSSEERRLCEAAEVLESFDGSANEGHPTFFSIGLRPGVPGGGSSTIDVIHVRTDWAASARRTLSQSKDLLMKPHHVELLRVF